MAIGSLSPVGSQQFFDNNGNPLAGGGLYWYKAGTDTPTPVYADANLAVPLANPVVLDSAGRAPAMFLAAEAYKCILKNAAGVVIWGVEPIQSGAALRSTSGTSSLTGTNHDVPVPTGVITYLTFTNATPLTITGFAGGTLGQVLIVRAGGTAPVHLMNYTVTPGSAAGNQLINMVTSGPTSLAGPRGMAMYTYVLHTTGVPFWFLVTHEQGDALRVPFDPLNFYPSTGEAGMAWTIEEGTDLVSQNYILKGSTLFITVQLRQTTLVGLPQYLIVAGWPYLARSGNTLPALSQYGTAEFESVVMSTTANQSTITFTRAGLSTWPDATNTLQVLGQLSVEAV